MTQPLKILAAVDLSDYSPITVRYGVWLAMKTSAELVLVNILNQRDIEMVRRAMVGYEAFSIQSYVADQIRERQARMEELFKAASPGTVPGRFVVREGIPYLELLSLIEAEKPNLLVISTKGRTNLGDVVVGSTARKMFRRSPIPVVAVPAGHTTVP